MKFFVCLLMQALVLLPLAAHAAESDETGKPEKVRRVEAHKAYGQLPVHFIENRGQVDRNVLFYEKGAGHNTFLTKDGVVVVLRKRGAEASAKGGKYMTETMKLVFKGADKDTVVTGKKPLPGRVNYFVGRDRSKWRAGLSTYSEVLYKDIYKNVDMRFYGKDGDIEYDVVVHPGADPSVARFAIEGAKEVRVTEEGEMEISLGQGRVIEERPVMYQEIDGKRVVVEGGYRLIGKMDGAFVYGFDVAAYDRTKDLVIDPLLEYSTYLGGSITDYGNAIAVDSTGAVYIAGQTNSSDFPVSNPIQGVYGGLSDAFVTKIDPTGTFVVYSTYFGGSDFDYASSLALDSAGAVYIAGQTFSPDFPLVGPVQGTMGGSYDGFVAKIDPTGSSIVYSTYLGGFDVDDVYAIAVDSTGAAYVTGYTSSPDFPLMNPLQGAFGGVDDVFVTKIDPSGSSLVYSTYLGGVDSDNGEGIVVDSTGTVYLSGYTSSPDFPLVNPIQSLFGGSWSDAFVAKIDPTGSTLLFSTFLGGSGGDDAPGLALDSAGMLYVAGSTSSTDFPVVNPIQAANAGWYDAFVSKIDTTTSSLLFSTYLGGTTSDGASAVAVDASGVATVAGYTSSADFPTVNPVQGTFGGLDDVFVAKMDASASSLLFSTFHGGAQTEQASGLALDSAGGAYVTGYTESADFPIVNEVQAALNGVADSFVFKISDAPLPVVTIAVVPDAASVVAGSTFGYQVTALNTTTTQQCFQYWEDVTLPGGSTYPPSSALFGPVDLCLAPGASQAVHLTHGVPAGAPLGAYTLNVFVGAYLLPTYHVIVDEAHSAFDVTALGPVTAGSAPMRSWRLVENGFSK